MDLQATCTSGTGAIPWLPIPKKDFLVVDLEPGIYFLRNRFVPDQYAGLAVGKGEGWRRMSWNSASSMRSSSEEDSKDEYARSIEEVQFSLLVTVIRDKFKLLDSELDYGNTQELQNINELLLMGFDYYAHDSSCTTLAGEEHLVNFFVMNPCSCPVIDCNASPTASQTDYPETEDIARLKQCFVRVRRLEDEFSAEFVEKLWNSYEESLKRKTDSDDDGDDEDYDVDISPAPPTKRRSGRGRKQKRKSFLKKKSLKSKYWGSSESSSDNDTTYDDDDDEQDEDYDPLGKRRVKNYCLRRRN